MNKKDYEFLVACGIGDGGIGVSKYTRKDKSITRTYTLNIKHSIKQEELLKYKADNLNRILGKNSKVRKIDNSGYEGVMYSVGGKSEIEPLYNLLYSDGKKLITKEVLSHLGLNGLAIWWMDDGSLTIRRKKTAKGIWTNGARIGFLNTYTDTKEESLLIVKWIQQLTGALPTVNSSKGKFRIRFNSHDLRQFCPAIEEYIIPSMKHKVDLKYIYNRNIKTTPEMFTPKHFKK